MNTGNFNLNNVPTQGTTINNVEVESKVNYEAEYFNLRDKMLQDAEEMEQEVIVPIDLEGIEGYYISNMGRVFSNKRW